jgi:hypothetical protein
MKSSPPTEDSDEKKDDQDPWYRLLTSVPQHEEQKELEQLRKAVCRLSQERLNHDFEQASSELDFLKEQVASDRANYPPAALYTSERRISFVLRIVEILKAELVKRSFDSGILKDTSGD